MTATATEVDPRFLDYPVLSFWYGLSYAELAEMPRWLKTIYYSELPSLLAQRQLMNIEAAAVPHMEQGPRERLLADLARTIEAGMPETKAPAVELTQAAYQMKMANAGIPVQFVDADGNPIEMQPLGGDDDA